MAFRFDAANHSYTIDGRRVPSITQLLDMAGEIDDRFYSEEACARGTEVHALTADFDLGGLDPATCTSDYRGYLLGHVKAMAIERPTILSVEEPMADASQGFGGRPDREIIIRGLRGVLEGKSGAPEPSHVLQTALQCLLVAPRAGLPAERLARFAIYWKANGRFRLVEHTKASDFAKAREIIRRYC